MDLLRFSVEQERVHDTLRLRRGIHTKHLNECQHIRFQHLHWEIVTTVPVDIPSSHSHRASARCYVAAHIREPFQRFFEHFAMETVETVSGHRKHLFTGLKPGENEMKRLFVQSASEHERFADEGRVGEPKA
jgi:hypothetical protein